MINAEKPEMKNLKKLITKYKTKPSIIDNPPIKILSNRSIADQNMKKNSYFSNNDTQLKSNREKDTNYSELHNFYTNRTKNELSPDKFNRLNLKQKFQTTTNLIKKRNSGTLDKTFEKQKEKQRTSYIKIENSYSTANNYINESNRLSKIILNKNEASNFSIIDRSQQSVSIKNNNPNETLNKNSDMTTKLLAGRPNYYTNPVNIKKKIYNMKQIPVKNDYFTHKNYNTNILNNIASNYIDNELDSNVKLISPVKSTNTNLVKSEQGLATTRAKEDTNPISNLNILSYMKNMKNFSNKSENSMKTSKEFFKFPKQDLEGKFNDCHNLTSNSNISVEKGMDERGLVGEFITATNERSNDQMLNINISPVIRKKQKPNPVIKINKINPTVILKILEFTQFDITPLLKTCRTLNNLIKRQFDKMSEIILKDFRAIYLDYFEIMSKTLIFEQNKSNSKYLLILYHLNRTVCEFTHTIQIEIT
jgi:hypothetical protein